MKRSTPLYIEESKEVLKVKIVKAIGAKVREAREAKGMSMEQLSHYLDTSRQAIFKIENGEYSFSLATVYIIAEALECDVKDLIPSEIKSSPE